MFTVETSGVSVVVIIKQFCSWCFVNLKPRAANIGPHNTREKTWLLDENPAQQKVFSGAYSEHKGGSRARPVNINKQYFAKVALSK